MSAIRRPASVRSRRFHPCLLPTTMQPSALKPTPLDRPSPSPLHLTTTIQTGLAPSDSFTSCETVFKSPPATCAARVSTGEKTCFRTPHHVRKLWGTHLQQRGDCVIEEESLKCMREWLHACHPLTVCARGHIKDSM